MATRYDKISTTAELVNFVKSQGLDTDTDSIVRVQDIIAKSPYEELAEIASDGAKQDTLFFILTHAWNWRDVIHFWNAYINPEHKELKDLKGEAAKYKQEIHRLKGEFKLEHEIRLAATAETVSLKGEVNRLQVELHDRDMTIMELKAELYDYMKREARKNEN